MQSLLAPFKNFLLNRAGRSRPVKEMRWLTGITGYTLMGMVRQSWLAVKVRHVSLLVTYSPYNQPINLGAGNLVNLLFLRRLQTVLYLVLFNC